MTQYEQGIRTAVRFMMTHFQTFSVEPCPGSVPYDANFHFSMQPDRMKPGELLIGSAEHRERMIKLVGDAAVNALEGNK